MWGVTVWWWWERRDCAPWMVRKWETENRD
jgi:hypothetical protein